jgi:hypothetical protein
VEAVPTVADASLLEVSEDELKASILLFYSLLDEQQRRLYAGLESLKLGRGGDRQLADFLDLDSHTVARGGHSAARSDIFCDGFTRAAHALGQADVLLRLKGIAPPETGPKHEF